MTKGSSLAAAVLFLTLRLVAQTTTMQPWLTRAGDNARTGWNSHETTLTQQTIITKGIRLQPPIPVVGDARGMEAQPLILPNVNVMASCLGAGSADGGVTCHQAHDVMLLPSMANVVRGVDAHTGAGLWQTGPLCAPVKSTAATDMHQINDHVGVLSTPVIDADTQQAYMVAACSVDNTYKNAELVIYVMSMVDGRVIKSVPMPESAGKQWKQRSSLVLTNVGGVKTVFFAHGSVYETSTGLTGGITAFDVATNTIAAELYLPEGIWMGGQGLIADANGYLYAITANGDFDPSQGFYGESFIKVKYTPAHVQAGAESCPQGSSKAACFAANLDKDVQASLAVVDQWSPWSDYQRTGQKPPVVTMIGDPCPPSGPSPNYPCFPVTYPKDKLSGISAPSEEMKPVGGKMSMELKDSRVTASINDGTITTYVYPMATGAWSDEDWGSAGPACIFSLEVCVAAGKDGIGYPIRAGNLGSTSVATVGTAANYGKLAAPCAWLTAYGPGPCDPADPRQLNVFINGDTAHLHMTPVQMYDPLLKAWTIFVWGENSTLHKWKVGSDGTLTYVAQSNEYASADVRGRTPGGMPGGFCSGSSRVVLQSTSTAADTDSALLVCSVPYGDANATITQGRLLVYDPIHLNADGTLKVLWDSQQFGIPYVFNKFMPPVIDGGEIILPDYAGRVLVFQ